MSDPAAFAMEEYKVLQEKMKNSRDILNRLETLTIGGAVVSFAVLLGIARSEFVAVPLLAWWAVFFILLAAWIRCSSYYLYIWRIQSYLVEIESMMSGRQALPGFETFNRRHAAGPFVSFTMNMALWAVLLGLALFLAIWRSMGKVIP